MLELSNILWVVPGVVFIHFYNQRRPYNNIDLQGWPYVFAVVIVAIFTWLPTKLLFQILFSFFQTVPSQKLKFVLHTISNNEILTQLLMVLTSSFFSILILWICKRKSISQWVFVPVYDHFYNKCIDLENKAVFLTLKNDKAYIGILWRYPQSPKSRHESQIISIVPLRSGYRDMETKIVKWNTYYPKYETKVDFINMETLIPRTEIVTFGKFNHRTFRHFEEIKANENET